MKNILFISLLSLFIAHNCWAKKYALNWIADDSPMFTMDIIQADKIFKGSNSIFAIPTENIIDLTPETNLTGDESFQSSLNEILAKLSPQESHDLFINIVSHGLPGFFIKKNGQKISLRDLATIVASSIPSALKPQLTIHIFYCPCYGASIFESFKNVNDVSIQIFTGSDATRKTPENSFYNTILLIGTLNREVYKREEVFSQNDWAFYLNLRRLPEVGDHSYITNDFSSRGFIMSNGTEISLTMELSQISEQLFNITKLPLNDMQLIMFAYSLLEYNK